VLKVKIAADPLFSFSLFSSRFSSALGFYLQAPTVFAKKFPQANAAGGLNGFCVNGGRRSRLHKAQQDTACAEFVCKLLICSQ